MVTFAVTLSDLIEKGGAYAGIGAFFGLAVLAVLFFAQARELKRLREWAGRAPERALELEQRVVEQAEAARRVRAEPQAQPFRRPGEPATVAAQAATAAPTTDGKPAEAQTPPAEEGSAVEHPVVAAAAGPSAAEGAPPAKDDADADADADTDEPAAAEREPVAAATGPAIAPAPGNGDQLVGKIPQLPPRATPAPPPRRAAPVPSPAAALRAGTPATRRSPPRWPEPEPEPEPSSRRTGVIVAAAGAGVVLAVVGTIAILGGGGKDGADPAQRTTTTPSASATSTATAGSGDRPSTAVAARGETTVAVLNGTTVAGLATSVNTRLQEAGFKQGPPPADYTDQARSASVVFYADSTYRTRAIEAAKLLDVTDIQPIIDAARQLAPGADVVVVVGADQSP